MHYASEIMNNPRDTPGYSQKERFNSGEGNSWFSRNANDLRKQEASVDLDFLLQYLLPFKDEINKILEIGCASGIKIAKLAEQLDALGHGIDPSQTAIENAPLSKNLQLQVGTADSLPFPDDSFDFVYFGFCLYLVDRGLILRTVAEADRVLKNGGFLAILDFDPGRLYKNVYVHSPGIFSFKNSYEKFLTGSGHYYQVSKLQVKDHQIGFSKNPDERISVVLLYKEPNPYKEN